MSKKDKIINANPALAAIRNLTPENYGNEERFYELDLESVKSIKSLIPRIYTVVCFSAFRLSNLSMLLAILISTFQKSGGSWLASFLVMLAWVFSIIIWAYYSKYSHQENNSLLFQPRLMKFALVFNLISVGISLLSGLTVPLYVTALAVLMYCIQFGFKATRLEPSEEEVMLVINGRYLQSKKAQDEFGVKSDEIYQPNTLINFFTGRVPFKVPLD